MAARLATATAAVVAASLLAAVFAGAVWGKFTAAAASSANLITAAADFRAPSSSATAIAKTAGGVDGYVKKGGAYYVYANVTDTGNPASGVSTVTANVSAITSGSTAVALSAGSFSVDGASYNRRSASLSADKNLAAGTASFSLTMKDVAANARTDSGLAVTVDNTAPTGSDVQTVNEGSIAGRAEPDDTIDFTYSEPPDPSSILAGWTGGATPVVVRLNNATNDTVTIFDSTNATQLPLGSVNLGRSDYATANLTFGASGTASTMVLSGSTVTVTLGTQSAAATTAASTGSMIWTPSATATDRAGNATATTAKTETGSADKDF